MPIWQDALSKYLKEKQNMKVQQVLSKPLICTRAGRNPDKL